MADIVRWNHYGNTLQELCVALAAHLVSSNTVVDAFVTHVHPLRAVNVPDAQVGLQHFNTAWEFRHSTPVEALPARVGVIFDSFGPPSP